MEFRQALEQVQESEEFKQFKQRSSDSYLVHGFCTIEKDEQSPWQVGFYSKKTEKIASFTATPQVGPPQEDEPFIKEGHVPALEEGKVKATLTTARKVAQKVYADKHKAENVVKEIAILQTLEGKPTWNLTLITHAFNMINVRVDAQSGVLSSTETHSVLDLGKRI